MSTLNFLNLSQFELGKDSINLLFNQMSLEKLTIKLEEDVKFDGDLVANNSLKELKLKFYTLNNETLGVLRNIFSHCMALEKLKLVWLNDESDFKADPLNLHLLYYISITLPKLKHLCLVNFNRAFFPIFSKELKYLEMLSINFMDNNDLIPLLSNVMNCPNLKKLCIFKKYWPGHKELSFDPQILAQVLDYAKYIEQIGIGVMMNFTEEFANTLINYGKNLRRIIFVKEQNDKEEIATKLYPIQCLFLQSYEFHNHW